MASPTQTRVPLFQGDVFNQVVTLLMTCIVILTAVITYWFSLADDFNGDAGRDAQMFALQGLGKRTIGGIQASYAETAASQRWLELDTLARLADQRGDTEGANRLRAARDRVRRLAPLLNAPYFDPARDSVPNIAAYQADTFLVDSIEFSERFEDRARLKALWSDRASAYTVMLTLLAVTLFLLGISTNSTRRLRVIFFSIGMVLTGIVVIWMLLTYLQPVVQVPDEAFAAYARAVGKFHQKEYAAATEEFDRALQLYPEYTNAYRDRGVAKYNAADYKGAAADFESALDNGDSSSDTASGLGFLYYILGEFELAQFIHAGVLQGPTVEFWMRANAALNLLAAGKIDEAKKEYDEILALEAKIVSDARAQGKEPAISLWNAFDDAANDLDSLSTCAATRVCAGAPPFQALSEPEEITRAAQEVEAKLREYAVALEYTSQPPPASVDSGVGEFVFTRQLTADNAVVSPSQTFTGTDEPIYVLIPFRNLREGAQIVLKIFVDRDEDDRLRLVDNYSLAEMGGADADIFLAITTGGVPLSAGAYRVEMYVDGKLAQTGEFTVTPP